MMARPRTNASTNYDAWDVVPDQYEELADLLRWAILAPSIYNSQPWSFVVENQSIRVAPDLNRALRVVDPRNRQMFISLGAAVLNLKVAARHFGWDVREEHIVAPGGNMASRQLYFDAGYQPTPQDVAMCWAIPRRVTNRYPHRNYSVSMELQGSMTTLLASYGLHLALIEDQRRKSELARLLYDANCANLADVGLAAELSLWLRPNATTAFDGMPGSGFGIPDFASRIFPKVARAGTLGEDMAAQERRLVQEQTEVVGAISAPEDAPDAWITVGEALQLVALQAVDAGLAVHALSALSEREDLLPHLRRIADTKYRPQIMFRLGYAVAEPPHSPRRPVSQVIAVGPAAERRLIAEDRPTIFGLHEDSYTLDDLARELGDVTIVDKYADEWLSELFTIRNPQVDFNSAAGQQRLRDMVLRRASDYDGAWVYFPWRRTVIHMPNEAEFLELLYSRNYPSIEREAQDKLAQLRVGVVGLSIGSNIVRALVMTGVHHLKIADFDTIAPSNSNRIGAGSVLTVGENKATVLARDVYEFNPYVELHQYPDGLHAANLVEFMDDLDIVIDHMSDTVLKVKMREMARHSGKIVLMAANTGLSPGFDVELPEDPELFGGRVSAHGLALMRAESRTFPELAQIAGEIFRVDEMPAALIENFLNILEERQNYGSQLGLTGYAVAAQTAYWVYEIARGNARRLARFKRLHLEQPDLFEGEETARARAAFKQTFYDGQPAAWSGRAGPNL
jgi:nitroreductase